MRRERPAVREVVLHIGSGKTGTSTVQRFLADRRDDLLAGGVLYPQAYGGVRHVHLSATSRPDAALRTTLAWRRSAFDHPDAYRAEHRDRLAAELARHRPDRLMFSDEGLYGLGPVALGSLRRMLDTLTERRTVLVYLRRQDDHLVSRYQQSVKTGCTERLTEFAERDHSDLYDYAARLDLWSRMVDPASVVVRPFEPARFVGGTLLGDLVAAAGLPLDVPHDAGVRRNESLDAETVEFLRLVNLDAVESLGARAGSIDNRALLDRLDAPPRGPLLTLPDARLDEFAERWAASNAAVSARYLGGAALFDAPRRTGATTTQQHLDPDRVDLFADLVGLGADRRERVRAIARREASAPRTP